MMVYCPVKKGLIDGGDCLVIVDVADGLINPSILHDEGENSLLPLSVEWNEETKQMCKNCQYHDDLDY